MLDGAASAQMPAASQAVSAYGLLQGEKAVAIAAHSHIIEFGIMAALLAFLQPYIFLTERWKQRWARVLLLGSLLLPIFVQLEIKWGLIAGGIADFGGLLVVVALAAMFVGVMRHTGHLDAQAGGAS